MGDRRRTCGDGATDHSRRRRSRWGAGARLGAWALLALLLFGFGLPQSPALAAAPEPLTLSPAFPGGTLSGRFSRLVDAERALSFADILRADADGRFKAGGPFLGAGQTRDIHWFRFDLRREPGAEADWILELGEAYVDHFDLYVPTAANGGAAGPEDYRVVRMGDFVPFSERPMQTRLHSAPLRLAEGTTTVYLRVDTISAMSVSARLWTPAAFAARQTTALVIHGVYFGVIIILVLGYAALGLLLRDSALLTYTGYMSVMLLYYWSANGLAAVFLPDCPGWLFNILVGSVGLGGTTAALLLWDRLLDLRRNFPRFQRLYQGIGLLCLLLALTANSDWFRIANPVVSVLSTIMTVVSTVLIVTLIRRNTGDLTLRFYLATTILSFFGMLLTQMKLRGVLPSDLPIEPYQLCALVGGLVMGAGLALRIRNLQLERAQAEQGALFATKRAEEQRIFVAMLSHEFRTPLASIDGAAQMIGLDVADRPMVGKRLERIRNTIRKLADLVDVFLSSQALDHGSLALQADRITLGGLLEIALDGLPVADADTRVTVRTATPDQALIGDVQFLSIAIGNIVQNALRYSPPGSPVTVSAAADADSVTIQVVDQGRGMSAEEAARVGAIYFRATSSQGTKGSGVGMYLTRKILDAHGGSLRIDSQVGKGSTVTLQLPIGPVAALETAERAEAAARPLAAQ